MTLDREALLALARRHGFDRVGIARVEPLEREGAALARWIADGHHASMEWMAETVEVRTDPRRGMLGSAVSVLALAASYGRDAPNVDLAPGRVARYARGRDYHNVLGRKVQKLAKEVRRHGVVARASVDSMPVLERAWAQRAGLGFIGKNSCLIVPGLGSHLFLACVLIGAELAPDAPMSERCGSCTRCLDLCPTSAFVAPRELDARRCISYLTIEHRGPIDEAMRPAMGDWVFGCDVCQDVCPFNRSHHAEGPIVAELGTHAALDGLDAEALLALDEETFRTRFEGSPLKRATLDGLKRNVIVALGNVGEKRHLPVLRAAPPALEELAAWASGRISSR